MRWTLLAIFGTLLTVLGLVGLGLEISHGSDIWRKNNDGIALIAVGGFCVWRALAQRESGTRSEPLLPALLWLAAVVAIGAALYLLAPPLAFLYAVVVGIIARFSLVAAWLGRE